MIDLQDVGVRFWTYQTLMGYFLEASAANKIDIVVLDRPNPIGGLAVQGPITTPGRENYVSYYAEPVRPGMTMGELANFFNGEKHLGAHLTVVKMTGWHRSDWYDNTGVLWVNPSPNLRSLTQTMVYPGTGLIEGTNVDVKGANRDSLRAFRCTVGCRDATRGLSERSQDSRREFHGRVLHSTGRGNATHIVGERVEGVEIVVNDRNAVDAPELGIEAVSALWKLYPKSFQVDKVDRLLLNHGVLGQIKAGEDPRKIAAGMAIRACSFQASRAKYLLYK